MVYDVRWQLPETVEFIQSRQYVRVALQFPDDLLPHAPGVAAAIQARLGPEHKVADCLLVCVCAAEASLLPLA